MNLQMAYVWALILLASGANSLVRASDEPTLPSQYAEAVLDVEGML